MLSFLLTKARASRAGSRAATVATLQQFTSRWPRSSSRSSRRCSCLRDRTSSSRGVVQEEVALEVEERLVHVE
eukprot:14038078-Heterocapsa_arctica.AAC.1